MISSVRALAVLSLFFLLGRIWSFQIREADRSCLIVGKTVVERRNFIVDVFTTATCTGTIIAGGSISGATTGDNNSIVPNIKVSPISHTFTTSSGSIKSIRENDATRLFTNARVVYLFDGASAGENIPAVEVVAKEVIDLTTKRKIDRGPGVTPGNVQTMDVTSITPKSVAERAKKMPDGDVLLVGPVPSAGTVNDGKILADTATNIGTFVGGKSSGGVISVLLNGPTKNFVLEESGFRASELLWYSLPTK